MLLADSKALAERRRRLASLLEFGRRIHRVIGRTASMTARAQRNGRRWFQGQSASRLAFT